MFGKGRMTTRGFCNKNDIVMKICNKGFVAMATNTTTLKIICCNGNWYEHGVEDAFATDVVLQWDNEEEKTITKSKGCGGG